MRCYKVALGRMELSRPQMPHRIEFNFVYAQGLPGFFDEGMAPLEELGEL